MCIRDRIKRAAPHLDTEIIEAWNSDPEYLLDHPLMAPPTEEELLRLAEYLEANTPETFEKLDIIESPPEVIESEEIVIEIAEEEIVLTEDEEEIVEEEEVLPEISKGPRTPQTMKRRKSKHPEIMSSMAAKNAGLAAAKEGTIAGEIPTNTHIPKTAIGHGREGKLPNIPVTIPNELRDAVRQEVTQRKSKLPDTKLAPKIIDAAAKEHDANVEVISPVAARGVKVQKNVSKRSRASSVPQRKLDLEKELDSWKFKEGDS